MQYMVKYGCTTISFLHPPRNLRVNNTTKNTKGSTGLHKDI